MWQTHFLSVKDILASEIASGLFTPSHVDIKGWGAVSLASCSSIPLFRAKNRRTFALFTGTLVKEQAPVPPPCYQRAQARLKPALHLDALTLVRALHLLALCHFAVRVAHRRCPPPLPAGPGGAPRTYSEASLLLIGLLRTLWRLSYQDMHDWLKSWPALALACGLPMGQDGQIRIPSKSQQCKRRHAAGAPLHESLFVLRLCTRCVLDSLEPVISSLTALPSLPGVALIPMPPMVMLQLNILVLFCAASECVRSSVAGQAYRSFFSFLPLMFMMLPLPNRSWHGPYSCTTFVHALFA